MLSVSSNISNIANTSKSLSSLSFKGVNQTPPLQSDEFVKSDDNKEKKEGLSTKAKVGIFAGIGIAGTIAFLIYKGRFSEAKKLAENIEFKPAQTVEEAIKFGKKHLGIKSYEGFENADLDAINWVNQGLVNVSNRMKGKLRMPKNIVYCSDPEWKNAIAGVVTEGEYKGFFGVNKDFFTNIDKSIDNLLLDLEKHEWLKIENNNLKFGHNHFDKSMIDELTSKYERYKNGNSTFNEKIALYETISNLQNGLNSLKNSPMYFIKSIFSKFNIKNINVDNKTMQINDIEKMSTDEQFSLLKGLIPKFKDKFQFNFQIKGSAFHTIYHEMGHVQDMSPRCLTTNKLNFEYSKYPDELKDWISNQEYMQTANKVSGYASSGPGEFIAETFAGMVEGKKFPKEVIDLYKKLKGPMLPEMGS